MVDIPLEQPLGTPCHWSYMDMNLYYISIFSFEVLQAFKYVCGILLSSVVNIQRSLRLREVR